MRSFWFDACCKTTPALLIGGQDSTDTTDIKATTSEQTTPNTTKSRIPDTQDLYPPELMDSFPLPMETQPEVDTSGVRNVHMDPNDDTQTRPDPPSLTHSFDSGYAGSDEDLTCTQLIDRQVTDYIAEDIPDLEKEPTLMGGIQEVVLDGAQKPEVDDVAMDDYQDQNLDDNAGMDLQEPSEDAAQDLQGKPQADTVIQKSPELTKDNVEDSNLTDNPSDIEVDVEEKPKPQPRKRGRPPKAQTKKAASTKAVSQTVMPPPKKPRGKAAAATKTPPASQRVATRSSTRTRQGSKKTTLNEEWEQELVDTDTLKMAHKDRKAKAQAYLQKRVDQ